MKTMPVQMALRLVAYMAAKAEKYPNEVGTSIRVARDSMMTAIVLQVGHGFKGVPSSVVHPCVGWLRFYEETQPGTLHKGVYSHLIEVLKEAYKYGKDVKLDDRGTRIYETECKSWGVEPWT